MNIQFLGAAKEVTGSKHLITTKQGLKILLDCGMYQGKGLETDEMNRDLGFEPSEIDYVILCCCLHHDSMQQRQRSVERTSIHHRIQGRF